MILTRLIFIDNMRILFPALIIGLGVYLITDLFERLDNFVEAGLGLSVIASYFLYKIPLIISQILPVVFFMATVIQLCLMFRNREMIALFAGGISPALILRIIFCCGLIWGGVQLVFSQWLGAFGEQQAGLIWQEQVRNKNLSDMVLHNVWFTEKNWIVSLKTLKSDDSGEGFLAYLLSEDSLSIEEIIQADNFIAHEGIWQLNTVRRILPESFISENIKSLSIKLNQNLSAFRIVAPGTKPSQLSLMQLGQAIKTLEASGSNVEDLRTLWHGKIAYAASLAVLALISLAIAFWKDNVYIACAVSLLITFLYYALFTVSASLGQKGQVPPVMAAWLGNILGTALALIRLWPILHRQKHAETHFVNRGR